MNYMSKIAEMLGVEIGEEFKVVDADGKLYDCIFKLTEDGSKSTFIKPNGEYSSWSNDPYMLSLLLTGKCSIVKKPWKPKNGENFYTISVSIDNEISVYLYVWRDNGTCNELYALGNCFRTKEEADKHKHKYIKWIRNKEPDTSWRE